MQNGYEILNLISGGPYFVSEKLAHYLTDHGISIRSVAIEGGIDYIFMLHALKGRRKVAHSFVTALLKARIPFEVVKESLYKATDDPPPDDTGELDQITLN